MTAPVLSGWWAGSTHRAMRGVSDEAVRLALALTPIQSVVRVIDDSVPSLRVEWAAEGSDSDGARFSMSYTDFHGGRIAINPLPITENKLVNGDAIDVCTGFAMHEASHAKHSRLLWQHLVTRDPETGKETAAFRPMRVAGYLLNLVEDVRIEGLTAAAWPGFAPYFEKVLDYMWTGRKPEKYGPDVASKLQTAFLACRYLGRVADDPHFAAGAFPAEVAWWQAWQADYLDGRADVPTTIQRGLDHLREDKKTRSEMDKMEQAERDAEAAGERIRKQIERLMKEGIEGADAVCVGADGEVRPLDAETAQKVRELVREGLVEHKVTVTGHGVKGGPIRVRRPEESPESRRSYVGKPSPLVQALRAALVFRASAPEHKHRLLREGTLDEDELYRWGMRDYRVFSDKTVEERPEVLMGLLVDLSGSMYGSKLRTAQELAQLFVWALHDQEGIETRVWGHTGDKDAEGPDVFRIWERGDPLSRLGLIASLPHANNYDSYAIEFCVRAMADAPQPQKVLVVLSDGLPSGSGYGGAPAERHVRAVCEWARRRHGIEVIQVAIDDDLRLEDQARMFGSANVIPFRSVAVLPRQLARLMARVSQ